MAGNLAPGNSIGTLTVNGNYAQNVGSTYTVEVNAAGQSDKLNVTGGAAIAGGTVAVQAQSGSYARNTSYTILTANAGVIGIYSSVTSNFAFLTPSLSYDANNVYLNLLLNQSAFADGAQTPNQFAVGTVLDQTWASATGNFATVLSALSVLTNAARPAGAEPNQRPALCRLRHGERAGQHAVHERRRPAARGLPRRRHRRRPAPGAGRGLRRRRLPGGTRPVGHLGERSRRLR